MADRTTEGLFGTPKRSTRWVKAVVDGAPETTGRLDTDGVYLSLDLIDLCLGRQGFVTTRFHPLFLSDLSVTTPYQTKLPQSALIDPRKLASGVEIQDARWQAPAITAICTQMPWQGRIDGELVALALRSETLVKAILDLDEHLSGMLPRRGGLPGPSEAEDDGDGHESLLMAAAGAVTGKLASTFLKKIGYSAVIELARILKAQDGTYQVRLRVPVSQVPLEPGYYVMLPEGARHESVGLDFSGARLVPLLRINGKVVRGLDYAIVRVAVTQRHQNIEDVPLVGDAWVTLQRVLEAGGQPEQALNAFCRVVTLSPHLIGPDRQKLIQNATEMVDSVRAYMVAEASEGHESILGSPLARFAFRTLKEVWESGSLDGLAGSVRKSLTDPGRNPGKPDPAVQVQPAPDAPEPAFTPAVRQRSTADRFEAALTFCLRWEGGYSDHPDDRGGKTNFGVTERVFHEWLESRGEDLRPVSEITHDEVRAIYWSEYWLKARCDRLKRQLDLLMFDASVNHGPERAVKLMQAALNSLGETLKVDGAFGSKTLAAIATHETKAIAAQYLVERRAFYHRIVATRPEQGTFLEGWLNRVADLEHTTGEGGLHADFESMPVGISPQKSPFAGDVD